jgi:hypothetical protein
MYVHINAILDTRCYVKWSHTFSKIYKQTDNHFANKEKIGQKLHTGITDRHTSHMHTVCIHHCLSPGGYFFPRFAFEGAAAGSFFLLLWAAAAPPVAACFPLPFPLPVDTSAYPCPCCMSNSGNESIRSLNLSSVCPSPLSTTMQQ